MKKYLFNIFAFALTGLDRARRAETGDAAQRVLRSDA